MVMCKHPLLPEGQWAEIANPRDGWEPVSEEELAAAERKRVAAAKREAKQRAAAIEAAQESGTEPATSNEE